ncbi:Glycosyl hydrolase family 57 [Poriferisphaera corsica]|uniref:Glycosyl hydrolase family 57 n=1 Tax=Poriferisphaera corsica TaxID=2528020 RepID=A0A517YUE2_9BACT|nr:glycoside hydrolase family 57 protein [Poriferisphaera corsica]QDU33838.1 Glycosyl hydrolase family 57 [Poriferisphaera corsica]
MASVCFYFQVHQPPRLKRYSIFDSGDQYFDDARNREILRKVAHRSYMPTLKLLGELIHKHDGQFRVSFSLTGCVIDQLRRFAPEVLEEFKKLAETGCVEFLAETYHHSLSFLYSKQEFLEQVELHLELIDEIFGQRPTIFRNTELIYNNELASFIADTHLFRGIIAEGTEKILNGRSPNHIFDPPDEIDIALLLKNYRLSDDIAYRFSNQSWPQWPLTAEKFAGWINKMNDVEGRMCNLFMDIETFGEHQWENSGIFDFMRKLPSAVIALGDDFKTPGECLDWYDSSDIFDSEEIISWADSERDITAWNGNAMQGSALAEIYGLEKAVKKTGDPSIIEDWRKLTCSDHFYYMCTKYFDDGAVHKYFSPYDSPYDGYINFMNVLDNLKTRLPSDEK